MLVRLKRWIDVIGVGVIKVRLQRRKRSVNCFGPEYSSDSAGDGPMKQASELAEGLFAQQIATEISKKFVSFLTFEVLVRLS